MLHTVDQFETTARTQSARVPGKPEIRAVDNHGQELLVVNNGEIQLTLLPALGGKVTSLRRIASGREFLVQPSSPPAGESAIEVAETGGFYDCFPTVAATEYPIGRFRWTEIPRHGEAWRSRWQYTVRGNKLWLGMLGTCLPYILRKCITVDAGSITLAYELESITDAPFEYLWSAYPLLQVEPDSEILLPEDVSIVGTSRSQGVEDQDRVYSWPDAEDMNGGTINLSRPGLCVNGTRDSVFAKLSSDGWCALSHPSSNESISIHFDRVQIPYLGISIRNDRQEGDPAVVLAPSTAVTNSLEEAIEKRMSRVLNPGERKRWQFRIQVQSGLPLEAAAHVLGLQNS